MLRLLKNNAFVVSLILFAMSVLPFLSKIFSGGEPESYSNELYNPSLSRLNTLDKLADYCDSLYASKGNSGLDTSAYTALASYVVKERFHHGPLEYTFSDNWLAYLCGKLFWSHLSSIVITDDILKHTKGLCSQQTMVFMEVLSRKKINMRTVGLGYEGGPGHFLCEVHYGGAWHLHDISMEPAWSNIENHHFSLEYYLAQKDSLYRAYESRLPKEIFYKILERFSYGEVNKIPAKNMAIFHRITLALTYLLPLCFLICSLWLYRRKQTAGPARVIIRESSGTVETKAL